MRALSATNPRPAYPRCSVEGWSLVQKEAIRFLNRLVSMLQEPFSKIFYVSLVVV